MQSGTTPGTEDRSRPLEDLFQLTPFDAQPFLVRPEELVLAVGQERPVGRGPLCAVFQHVLEFPPLQLLDGLQEHC